MTGFDKPPAPPTGGDEIAFWARLLTNWLAKGQIKSIQGAKQIPDPNGGFHLIIPPAKYPPQITQPSSASFYPFKIYQPTNVSQFIGQTVPLVVAYVTGGAFQTCKIVNAQTPTNLALNPPQISVADTWRFWAVRSGIVEVRMNYGVSIPDGGPQNGTFENFAFPVVPPQCDNVLELITGQWSFWYTPFASDSTSTTAENIIVLGGNLSAEGFLTAPLWIETTQDSASTVFPTANIRGFVNANSADNTEQIFTEYTREQFSLGAIAIQPSGAGGNVAVNFIFDNVRARYPVGNGNWPSGGGNGTVTNIRGNSSYDTQSGDGETGPADLATQLFYPGDLVADYNVTGDAVNWNTIWVFTGPLPAFVTAHADTTAINFADSNWTPWFGSTAAKPASYP